MSLPHTVDKGLRVGHGEYAVVGYMISLSDPKHNPIAGSGKSIYLAFHVLWNHPGFAAIEENCHTGGIKQLDLCWIDNCIIVLPPYFNASAVIAASKPAALLDFILEIAEMVSSRVGGSSEIGRS